MRRTGPRASIVTLIAGGALVLAACGTDADESAEPTEAPEETQAASSGTFTYGYEQECDGVQQRHGRLERQQERRRHQPRDPGLLALRRRRHDRAEDRVRPLREDLSDDPLTVKYTFNENATWSDGEPIDCDDAYLSGTPSGGLNETFNPLAPPATT